jgi:hypothetical protein
MAYNSNFEVLKSAKVILFCIVVMLLLFLAQIVCITASGDNSDVVNDLKAFQHGDIIAIFKAIFHLLTFSIIPFPFNIAPIFFVVITTIIITAFVVSELLALIPSWLFVFYYFKKVK